MKILVTGLTGPHVGRGVRGLQRLNPPEWIVKALRAAAHEVTWTGLHLGDPIPEHHLMWFVASSPQALGARTWGLGALSALGRTRSPYLVQLDDWKLNKPFNDASVVLRDPARQLHKVMQGKPYYGGETDADISRYEPCILAGIERMLAQRGEPAPYVVLAYRWGDVELLRRHLPPGAGQIIGLDVSPSAYGVIADQTPVLKERRWLLAVLAKHPAWLRKTHATGQWPLHVLGPTKRGGQAQTNEAGVYDACRRSWGVLSPPYPHAGSGWYRTRILYSAAARSVLLTENGEADALGPAYMVTRPYVEGLGDAALRDLAEAQAAALRPWMPTWDEFVAQCDAIVRGVRS